MFYSDNEKREFWQGYYVGRSDYLWCKNDVKKIKDCIETRKRMKQLCIERNDKLGVSFQNGYLKFFKDSLKK